MKGVRNLGVVEEQSPKRVDEGGVQSNAHGDRLTPPIVDAIGSSQAVENREFNPLAYSFPPLFLAEHSSDGVGGLYGSP